MSVTHSLGGDSDAESIRRELDQETNHNSAEAVAGNMQEADVVFVPVQLSTDHQVDSEMTGYERVPNIDIASAMQVSNRRTYQGAHVEGSYERVPDIDITSILAQVSSQRADQQGAVDASYGRVPILSSLQTDRQNVLVGETIYERVPDTDITSILMQVSNQQHRAVNVTSVLSNLQTDQQNIFVGETVYERVPNTDITSILMQVSSQRADQQRAAAEVDTSYERVPDIDIISILKQVPRTAQQIPEVLDLSYERVPDADIASILRQARAMRTQQSSNTSVTQSDADQIYERVPNTDIREVLRQAASEQNSDSAYEQITHVKIYDTARGLSLKDSPVITMCSHSEDQAYESISGYERVPFVNIAQLLHDIGSANRETPSTPGISTDEEVKPVGRTAGTGNYERIQCSVGTEQILEQTATEQTDL